MARSVFAGTVYDLLVEEDAGNADALVLVPSTVLPLYNSSGVLQSDFLLWDGSDYTIAASQITSDSTGHIPDFEGPDGLTILYDVDGNQLLSRDVGGGGSGSVAVGDLTDITTVGEALALSASAAAARTVIGAGTSDQTLIAMTAAELTAKTATTLRGITAAVLAGAGVGFANIYLMDVWDGTGTHPLRPTGLPSFFKVWWRQPVAPQADSTHALDGDMWTVTA